MLNIDNGKERHCHFKLYMRLKFSAEFELSDI